MPSPGDRSCWWVMERVLCSGCCQLLPALGSGPLQGGSNVSEALQQSPAIRA